MNAKVLAFLESLLNPEENGLAVQPHVRDEARRLLGLTPCEERPMAAMKQHAIRKVESNPMEYAEALRELAENALFAVHMYRKRGRDTDTDFVMEAVEESALFAKDLLDS